MSTSNSSSPVECGFYEVDAYKKVTSYTTPVNTGIPASLKAEFANFTYTAGSSRIFATENIDDSCTSVAWTVDGSILTLTEMSPELPMTQASFAFDLGINLLPQVEIVKASSFASPSDTRAVLAVYVVSVNNIIFRLEFPYPSSYSSVSVFSTHPSLYATSFSIPSDTSYDISTPDQLSKLKFVAVDASTLLFFHTSSATMVLKQISPHQTSSSTAVDLAEQPASSIQSLFGLFKAMVPLGTSSTGPLFTILAVLPLNTSTTSSMMSNAQLLVVCSDKKLRIWSSEKGIIHTVSLRAYETYQAMHSGKDTSHTSPTSISTAMITRAADNKHTVAIYTSYENAAVPIIDIFIISPLPAPSLPALRTRTNNTWVTAAFTTPVIDDTHLSGVDNSFTLSSCGSLCVCYLDSVIDKPSHIRSSIHTVQDHGAAITPLSIVASHATVWVLYGIGVLSTVRTYTLALAFKHNSSQFPTLVNIDITSDEDPYSSNYTGNNASVSLDSLRVAFPSNGERTTRTRTHITRLGRDGRLGDYSHRSMGNLMPSTPLKGSTRMNGTPSLTRADSSMHNTGMGSGAGMGIGTPAHRRGASSLHTPGTHRRGASSVGTGAGMGIDEGAIAGTITRTGTGTGGSMGLSGVSPCNTQWQTIITSAEAQWLLEARDDVPEALIAPPVSLAEHYLTRLFKPGRFTVETVVRAINYMRDDVDMEMISANFQWQSNGSVGFGEEDVENGSVVSPSFPSSSSSSTSPTAYGGAAGSGMIARDKDGYIVLHSVVQLQRLIVDTVLQYAHRLCEEEGISIPESGKYQNSENPEDSEAYDSIIMDVWTKLMYFTYTVAEASSPSLAIYGMGYSCFSPTPILIKPRNISLLMPLDALSALTLTQQLSLPLHLQLTLPSLPLPEGIGYLLTSSRTAEAHSTASRSHATATSTSTAASTSPMVASSAAVTAVQRFLGLASLFTRVRCQASGDIYEKDTAQTCVVEELIQSLKEDMEKGSTDSTVGVSSDIGLSALGTGPWRQHVVEPFVFSSDPLFLSINAIINTAKAYIETATTESSVFTQYIPVLLDTMQHMVSSEGIATLRTSIELLLLLLSPDCDHSIHGSSVFTFPALDGTIPQYGKTHGARAAVLHSVWSVANITINTRVHLLHNLLAFFAFLMNHISTLNPHVHQSSSSSLSVSVEACECDMCGFYHELSTHYITRIAALYKHYRFIYVMSQTLLHQRSVISLAREDRDMSASAVPLTSVLPAGFTRSLMQLQEHSGSNALTHAQTHTSHGVTRSLAPHLTANTYTGNGNTDNDSDGVVIPYTLAADTTITSTCTTLAKLLELLAETQPSAAATSLVFTAIRSLGLYSSSSNLATTATSTATAGAGVGAGAGAGRMSGSSGLSPTALANLLAVLAILKQHHYIPIVLAFAHSLTDSTSAPPMSIAEVLRNYTLSLPVGGYTNSVITALLQTSTASDYNALVDPELYVDEAFFPNMSPMPSLLARALPSMQSAWATAITTPSHPLISEITLSSLLQATPSLSLLAPLCALAAHTIAEYAKHIAFALQAHTNATGDIAAAAEVAIHRGITVAKTLSAAVTRSGDETILTQCSSLLTSMVSRITDISILFDSNDQPLVSQDVSISCYTLQFDMALAHHNLPRAHQALLHLPESMHMAYTRKFVLAVLGAPGGVKTLLSLSWNTLHRAFVSCLSELAATAPILPCLPTRVLYTSNGRLVAQGKATTAPAEVLFAYYTACGEHNNAAHALYLYILRIEAEVLAHCFNADGEVSDANTILSAIAAIEKALLCAVNALSISLEALHITLVQTSGVKVPVHMYPASDDIEPDYEGEDDFERDDEEAQPQRILKMVTVADLRTLLSLYRARGTLLHSFITTQDDEALTTHSSAFYPTHNARAFIAVYEALLATHRYADALALVKLCIDFPSSMHHFLPTAEDVEGEEEQDTTVWSCIHSRTSLVGHGCHGPARTRMQRSLQGVHGLNYVGSYLTIPTTDATDTTATATSRYNTTTYGMPNGRGRRGRASYGYDEDEEEEEEDVCIFTEEQVLEVVAAFAYHCYEQQPYINTTPYDNTIVYPLSTSTSTSTTSASTLSSGYGGTNVRGRGINTLSASLPTLYTSALLSSPPLALPRHHLHRTDAGIPLSTAVALPDTTQPKLAHLHLLVQHLTPMDLSLPRSHLVRMLCLRVRIAATIVKTLTEDDEDMGVGRGTSRIPPQIPSWLLSFLCPVSAVIPAIVADIRDGSKDSALAHLYTSLLNATVAHLPLVLPLLAKVACYGLMADAVSHTLAFHALVELYNTNADIPTSTSSSSSSSSSSSAVSLSSRSRSPSLSALAQATANLVLAAADSSNRPQIAKAAVNRLLAHCALLPNTAAGNLAAAKGVSAQDLSAYGCDAHTIALVLANKKEGQASVVAKPLSYAALSTQDIMQVTADPTARDATATATTRADATSTADVAAKTATPFSFTMPAPAPTSTPAAAPAMSTSAATPAPAPTFSFGNTIGTTASTPAFSFGASTVAPAASSTTSLPVFTFGASTVAPAASSTTSLPTFMGASTAAPAASTTTSLPAFSFGASTAAPAASSTTSLPVFTFGASTVAPAASSTTSLPTFMGASTAAPAASTTTSLPAFSFGASTAAPAASSTTSLPTFMGASTAAPAASTTTSLPAFSFGASTAAPAASSTTSLPTFMGASTAAPAASTTTSLPVFTFGASTVAPAASSTTSLPTFMGASTAAPAASTTTSLPVFTFGASTVAPAASSTTSLPTFMGASTAAPAASTTTSLPAFSFGASTAAPAASSTTSLPTFMGASTAAPAASTTTSLPAFSFGASTVAPAASSTTSLPTFMGASTAAPAASTTTSLPAFSFGASTVAPAASSTTSLPTFMGASTAAPAASTTTSLPAFSFGASTVAPAASSTTSLPTFMGASTAAPAASTTTSLPAFSFGASTVAPAASSTTSLPTFMGASTVAPAASSTTSLPAFSFGASTAAPAASTTTSLPAFSCAPATTSAFSSSATTPATFSFGSMSSASASTSSFDSFGASSFPSISTSTTLAPTSAFSFGSHVQKKDEKRSAVSDDSDVIELDDSDEAESESDVLHEEEEEEEEEEVEVDVDENDDDNMTQTAEEDEYDNYEGDITTYDDQNEGDMYHEGDMWYGGDDDEGEGEGDGYGYGYDDEDDVEDENDQMYVKREEPARRQAAPANDDDDDSDVIELD